jgi:hypothetical protein
MARYGQTATSIRRETNIEADVRMTIKGLSVGRCDAPVGPAYDSQAASPTNGASSKKVT